MHALLFSSKNVLVAIRYVNLSPTLKLSISVLTHIIQYIITVYFHTFIVCLLVKMLFTVFCVNKL